MAAIRKGLKCAFCKKTNKYKCLNCQLPACNLCTVFEENEEITGWQLGISVGYCGECQLKSEHKKREDLQTNVVDDTERSSENFDGLDYEAQLTLSPSQEAMSSELQGYDSDASYQSKCRRKKSGKKAGGKALWSDATLDDFVDIITASEYYKKKLIFTNTKNQKNSQIYENILTELKSRCDKRRETIDFTIVQMRNKFLKCISECKHAAMTIKTATGIKRFQEGKGYGAWFKQLFALVQSRDSCQPERAVEPSSSSSTTISTCSTSNTSFDDLDEDDELDSSKNEAVKSFAPVPVKKKKVSAKDQIGEAVRLLNTIVANDPSKELIHFMQEEAERSWKHEIEMTKLMLSAIAPQNQPTEGFAAPSGMQLWKQDHNSPSSPFHFQHPVSYQTNSMSTTGFVPPTPTYQCVNTSPPNDIGKHYHTM